MSLELQTITGSDRLDVRLAFARISGVLDLDSRADILTTSIVYSEIKRIRVQGYAAVGDAGAEWSYKRRSSAPSDTSNPYYAQTADSVWFELESDSGSVRIEQFGGKADSDINGTTGTDNLAALQYAVSLVSWQVNSNKRYGYRILFGGGHYRFSDTFELHRCVFIEGVGGGFEGDGATNWHFPANKTFVIIGNSDTTGEGTVLANQGDANGTTIRNIVMYGKTTSTDHDRCGVLLLTIAHLDHVHVARVGGDGFRVWGRAGIHLSDFTTLTHCSVHGCSRNGLRIEGNDANVCKISHFSAHGPTWEDGNPIDGGVGGCGIWDSAAFGNEYDNIHIAGFGNHGVQHGGRAYRLITYCAEAWSGSGSAVGEATTPGTNDEIWYDVGALASPTSQFPAWSATPTVPHRPQIPILTNGAGHVFFNVYVETIYPPCHLPGLSISFGGTHDVTRYSNTVQGGSDVGLWNCLGFGGRRNFVSGQQGYTYSGESTSAGVGNALYEPNKGLTIVSHYRQRDGSGVYNWRYYQDDLVYKLGDASSGLHFWSTTTTSTAKTFGRSTAQPHYMVFYDHAVENPGDANQGRIEGIRDAAPGSGYHAQGEWFRNVAPTAGGTFGWVCVTSGTPGTWKAIPVPA